MARSYLPLERDGAGLAPCTDATGVRWVSGAGLDLAVEVLKLAEATSIRSIVQLAQVGLEGQKLDGRVGGVEHLLVIRLKRCAMDAAPLPAVFAAN